MRAALCLLATVAMLCPTMASADKTPSQIGEPVPAVNCDTGGATCGSSTVFAAVPDCGGPVSCGSVSGLSGTVAGAVISVDMDHTWVGDMNMTLTHVDTGTSATLLCRTGLFDPSCPTSGCCGCSDDIGGVYSFDDASTGAILGDPFSGCYGGFAAPGCYRPVSALSAFDGESASGTWTLTGQDGACGDLFYVYGWTLCFTGTTAAEPSTWGTVKNLYQ